METREQTVSGVSVGNLRTAGRPDGTKEMAADRREGANARDGLAFVSILSFLVCFFGSRVFTTLYPDAVVVSGGILFHHFWYGILLAAAACLIAGLLLAAAGLAMKSPKSERARA
jgi:hypothetical protein